MKELIFHPTVLPLLILVGLVYLVLIAQLVKRPAIEIWLRYTTSFLFLLTSLNLTIAPFVYLFPEALAGWDKTAGSAMLQLGIYAVFILILLDWFKRLSQSLLLLFQEKSLGVFLFYSMLSCFWSETPLISFKYCLTFVGSSLMTVHIAREYTWCDLTKILRYVMVAVAIGSLVWAVVKPGIALGEKGLTGIMPFPIKLGTAMALGICLWVNDLLSTRNYSMRNIAMIGVQWVAMTWANSAQAMMTFSVLLGFMFFLRSVKSTRPKFLPAVTVFYLAFGVVGLAFVQIGLPLIFAALGKDMTLTGRTEFWPQVLDRWFQHNLLLGYGINGFWQPWRGDADPAAGIMISGGFIPPHAHNGFLDVGAALGLIGLVLFGVSLLRTSIRAIQYLFKAQVDYAVLPLLILMYLIFSNLSETQLMGANYIWLLYVLVITRLHLEQKTPLIKLS